MPRGGKRENAGRKPKPTLENVAKSLPELDARQAKYVVGRVAGKSKKDAAIDAGYSPATAVNPGVNIETENVREAFRRLVRAAAPPEKLVQRLAEGLDAEQSQVSVLGGVSNMHTEVNSFTDFRERREYLKLAAEFGAYHVPKQELEVNDKRGDIDQRVAELLARASARASQAPQA